MAMQDLHNERTKAIGMAIGAGIIAAVATMFVPTSMLEALTGATGLSELVPATAAPLGDKARAIIAFATGAVTLALAIGMLSRSNKTAATPAGSAAANITTDKFTAEREERESTPLLSQIQKRLGAVKMPKMPWVRNEAPGDVYELSDLPQLRTQDAHPDTPRRRPISAATDFGDIGLDGKQVYIPDVSLPGQRELTASRAADFSDAGASDAGAMEAEIEIQNSVDQQSFETPFLQNSEMEFAPMDFGSPIDFENATLEADSFETHAFEQETFAQEFVAAQPETMHPEPFVPATEFAAAMDDVQPSLAELVAKFEAAVTRRTEQLAALESLASRLVSQPEAAADATAPVTAESQPPVEFQPAAAMPQPQEFAPLRQAQRPPLEAVPSAKRSDSDDDMDAALNAALATLQRMNAK